MNITLHSFKDKELKNAIAIVGFPSIGLVSSIATNFLARELKLEVIAGFTSPDFPPYTMIQNGVPLPQVRIYAGERDCEDESGVDCDSLVVITSEFMPKIEEHHIMAEAIMQWLSDNGVAMAITLDGIPLFNPDDYVLLGAGSTPVMRDLMKNYGIQEFEEGMIRGISGVMLFEGANKGIDVITLLGSARADMPDPRGAAKLMEPLSKMFPELKIDTEPLYTEAEELDRRIKAQNAGEMPPELPKDQVLYG